MVTTYIKDYKFYSITALILFSVFSCKVYAELDMNLCCRKLQDYQKTSANECHQSQLLHKQIIESTLLSLKAMCGNSIDPRSQVEKQNGSLLHKLFKERMSKLINDELQLLKSQYDVLKREELSADQLQFKKFFLLNQFRSVILSRNFDLTEQNGHIEKAQEAKYQQDLGRATSLSHQVSSDLRSKSDGGTLASVAMDNQARQFSRLSQSLKTARDVGIESEKEIFEKRKLELIGQNNFLYHNNMVSSLNDTLFRYMTVGKERRPFVAEMFKVDAAILKRLKTDTLGVKDLEAIFVGSPEKPTSFYHMLNQIVDEAVRNPQIQFAIDIAYINRINGLKKGINLIETTPFEKLGLDQMPTLASSLISSAKPSDQSEMLHSYCRLAQSGKKERLFTYVGSGVCFIGGVALTLMPFNGVTQTLGSGLLFAGSTALSGIDLYKTYYENIQHDKSRALYYVGAMTPAEFKKISSDLETHNNFAIMNSFFLLASVAPMKISLGAQNLKPRFKTPALLQRQKGMTEEEMGLFAKELKVNLDEFKALRRYAIHTAEDINSCLRVKICSKEQLDEVSLMLEGLSKMRAGATQAVPETLYRGVKGPIGVIDLEDAVKAGKPVALDRAFMSTSVDESVARFRAGIPDDYPVKGGTIDPRSRAILVIKTKTQKCVDFRKLSPFQEEQEFLCPPNMKFLVKKDSDPSSLKYYLEEIVD